MFASKAKGWVALFCAFLVGLCACPFAVYALYTSALRPSDGKQYYVGRTTVMVLPHSSKANLDDLASIAASQEVFSPAAKCLSELGVDPQQALSSVTVAPVKGTNTLAIEAKLTDAREAKVVADVMGVELKKAYARLYSGKNAGTLKTIDPTYVTPAPQHGMKSIAAYIANTMTGPFTGLIAGLAFGVLFGLLIQRPRKPVIAQQGV